MGEIEDRFTVHGPVVKRGLKALGYTMRSASKDRATATILGRDVTVDWMTSAWDRETYTVPMPRSIRASGLGDPIGSTYPPYGHRNVTVADFPTMDDAVIAITSTILAETAAWYAERTGAR